MKNTLNKLQILTPNGFKHFLGIRRKEAECIKILFSNSSVLPLTVSVNHTFIVNNISTMASNLKKGDFLSHKHYGNVEIADIEYLGNQDVYDPVEVDGDNTYYSDDIISHNCSFIGSTATLIAAEYLEMMVIAGPKMVKYDTLFKIYAEPEKGKTYILGIDVAEGVGGDYSVVQVLSINKSKQMEQVAVYANNTIKPYDFAQICIGISDYYNEAEMLIENNNSGQVLLTTIWYDYDVDRIINTDTKKGRRELGIRATTRTKSIGTANLKRCIENGWLKIVDATTITELGQFEEVRPGVYKASSETGHDDHVKSLLWGAYFIESGMFEAADIDAVKVIDDDYILVPAVLDDDYQYGDEIPNYINPWGYEDTVQYQANTIGENYDYQYQYDNYVSQSEYGTFIDEFENKQYERQLVNQRYEDFFS